MAPVVCSILRQVVEQLLYCFYILSDVFDDGGVVCLFVSGLISESRQVLISAPMHLAHSARPRPARCPVPKFTARISLS